MNHKPQQEHVNAERVETELFFFGNNLVPSFEDKCCLLKPAVKQAICAD